LTSSSIENIISYCRSRKKKCLHCISLGSLNNVHTICAVGRKWWTF